MKATVGGWHISKGYDIPSPESHHAGVDNVGNVVESGRGHLRQKHGLPSMSGEYRATHVQRYRMSGISPWSLYLISGFVVSVRSYQLFTLNT